MSPTFLADPTGDSALLGAVSWIRDTMLGEAATVVAIVAVAAVGAAMLAGRVDVRRGLTVVLGCFVLFGAGTIAAGIRSAIDTADGGGPDRVAAAVPAPPPPVPVPPRPPVDDPYAGASVFPRR